MEKYRASVSIIIILISDVEKNLGQAIAKFHAEIASTQKKPSHRWDLNPL